MIGKYLNSFKKISLNSIFLCLIILLLFVIANLLFSINNTLGYIYREVSINTTNNYGTLLEISNKNNTNWTKDKLNEVENNIKLLNKLFKETPF